MKNKTNTNKLNKVGDIAGAILAGSILPAAIILGGMGYYW